MSGTGKTCRKCGMWYADAATNFKRSRVPTQGFHSPCFACRRADKRRWSAENPEHGPRHVAKRRERRQSDAAYRDKDRTRNRESYARHAEKRKAYQRRYRAENRELVRARDKRYYAENRTELDAKRKAYNDRIRDRYLMWQRIYVQRRRARMRGAAGYASKEQILARIAYYGGRCYLCGKLWQEIDHVIPVRHGGSNWPANLRPACKSCNARKRDRRLSELGHRNLISTPLE